MEISDVMVKVRNFSSLLFMLLWKQIWISWFFSSFWEEQQSLPERNILKAFDFWTLRFMIPSRLHEISQEISRPTKVLCEMRSTDGQMLWTLPHTVMKTKKIAGFSLLEHHTLFISFLILSQNLHVVNSFPGCLLSQGRTIRKDEFRG